MTAVWKRGALPPEALRFFCVCVFSVVFWKDRRKLIRGRSSVG